MVRHILANMPEELEKVPIGTWSFPVIVGVGSDNPKIVGTAFPVTDRVLVTAKHVLVDYRDGTNTEIYPEDTLGAIQVVPGKGHIPWKITTTDVHREADLAVLIAEPSEDKSGFWVPRWTFSKTAPRIGEWVGAFGHIEGHCQIMSRNPGVGGTIEFGSGGQANFGVVQNVYEERRDRVMLPCPCFEVGADFGPGMSGGPVFNEQGEICGIVSSAVEGTHTSYALTLWPSLWRMYRRSEQELYDALTSG